MTIPISTGNSAKYSGQNHFGALPFIFSVIYFSVVCGDRSCDKPRSYSDRSVVYATPALKCSPIADNSNR